MEFLRHPDQKGGTFVGGPAFFFFLLDDLRFGSFEDFSGFPSLSEVFSPSFSDLSVLAAAPIASSNDIEASGSSSDFGSYSFLSIADVAEAKATISFDAPRE